MTCFQLKFLKRNAVFLWCWPGVVAAGQQAVLTTVAGAHPVAVAPQAVMVPTQTVSHLLTPATCLSANTVQIPATLNVLQRQLSAPGTLIFSWTVWCGATRTCHGGEIRNLDSACYCQRWEYIDLCWNFSVLRIPVAVIEICMNFMRTFCMYM